MVIVNILVEQFGEDAHIQAPKCDHQRLPEETRQRGRPQGRLSGAFTLPRVNYRSVRHFFRRSEEVAAFHHGRETWPLGRRPPSQGGNDGPRAGERLAGA